MVEVQGAPAAPGSSGSATSVAQTLLYNPTFAFDGAASPEREVSAGTQRNPGVGDFAAHAHNKWMITHSTRCERLTA
jgi:hypothetical protein